MEELHNPLIKEYPFKPRRWDSQDSINPNRDMILELEIPHDVFAPGATSWNRMRYEQKKNLSDTNHHLIENFLALAEITKSVAERHSQLSNVRLFYISVLCPTTFHKMQAAKTTPKQMHDKNYYSHILRLVATPKGDMNRMGAHTFGNLQKVINSQKERLAMKETKRKRRRRDDEGDSEEQEPIEDKWRKIAHLGIWERDDVPHFLNPKNNFGLEDLYKYVHAASEPEYKRLVDTYLGAKSVEQLSKEGENEEIDDINHPQSSYNPINVFSPMPNYLRRSAHLSKHVEYAASVSKGQSEWSRINEASSDRDERQVLRATNKIKRTIQEEMRFDKWVELDRNQPLSVQGAGPDDYELNVRAIKQYRVPYEGETTWLLDINDFKASTFRRKLFPWASKLLEAGMTLEKRAYIANAPRISQFPQFLLPEGVRTASTLLGAGERDAMERVLSTEEDLGDLYDHQVNLKSSSGMGGVSLARWAGENRRRLAEAHAQTELECKNETNSEIVQDCRRKNIVQAKLNSLDEFEAKIHTSEMTASPARRAIASWYDERKNAAQEKNEPCLLSFPRDHVHNNLSALGDALAGEAQELDSLFYVQEGHTRIVTKLISILQIHIPFYIKDKPRSCNIHCNFINQSREGGTSKSFTDEVVQKHMRLGTYAVTDRLTPQFLSGSNMPPDENGYIEPYHKMVLFMDELQPGLLETDGGTVVGNANSAGHSEMLKTVQTKGMFTVIMPILERGRAARSQGEIKSRCEVCCFFNTNRSLASFSHSSLSRYIINYASGSVSSGGNRPDVIDKMSEESNISLVNMEKRKRRIEKWNRNQFIASIIGQLIEGEVLEPIDTSCADQVYRWVKDRAKKYNLTGFHTSRNFDLFRSLVQGLVVYELCHKMFDIPAAPFADRPWTFRDALWFQKHLVSTVEHATVAFGMMRSCFEEDGMILTTRLLFYWIYDLYQKPQNPVVVHNGNRSFSTAENQVTVNREPMANDQFCNEIRVSQPSCFRNSGNPTDDQLLSKLTIKLLSLKSLYSWSSPLTEDTIRRSLQLMRERIFERPHYSVGTDGQVRVVPGVYSYPCELRIESQAIIIPCEAATLIDEHTRVTQQSSSLHQALQDVLEHQYSNKRDLLFGAARPGMTHAFDVISVTNSDRTLELVQGENKVPLMTDIDEHFVLQFNAKIDVGKCMLRVYPSNYPDVLMRQLYLFQTQWTVTPPYPTHDPLYFADDHNARIELYNKLQRRQALYLSEAPRHGGMSEALWIEAQTQGKALENVARLFQMKQQLEQFDRCGRGSTPTINRLLSGDFNPDCQHLDFLNIAKAWLEQPAHKLPIHPQLLRLSSPSDLWKEHTRRKGRDIRWVPEHLEHPVTTMEFMSRGNVIDLFMTFYKMNVKTMTDFTINAREATLSLGTLNYRVLDSGLQYIEAQKSYRTRLKEIQAEDELDDSQVADV